MMKTSIPNRVLLGPGPSDVPSRVLSAMSQPTIGHLDPVFLGLMDGIQAKLQRIFQTENETTIAVSGTGSAGMDTVLANLIEPRDTVLVCVNGVFGGRMADCAARYGAKVSTIDKPWGKVFEVDEVVQAIERVQPKVVAIVHAETSTGAHQPLKGIGQKTRENGALLVVDCVTSLGGVEVKTDEWMVDAAFSGTQKCLSCPPGLSPVTFSNRAMQIVDARATQVASWYLDVSMVRKYWGTDRAYHHTAPINMLYALNEGLDIVLEEGLTKRFARHQEMHELLKVGLADLGIEYVTQPGYELPMLNAVRIPEGVDDVEVRQHLLNEHGIEIGGGLGAYKGNAWRIGLMGASATERNVTQVLAALREAICI